MAGEVCAADWPVADPRHLEKEAEELREVCWLSIARQPDLLLFAGPNLAFFLVG